MVERRHEQVLEPLSASVRSLIMSFLSNFSTSADTLTRFPIVCASRRGHRERHKETSSTTRRTHWPLSSSSSDRVRCLSKPFGTTHSYRSGGNIWKIFSSCPKQSRARFHYRNFFPVASSSIKHSLRHSNGSAGSMNGMTNQILGNDA